MRLIDHLKQNPFTLSLSSGFFGFFAHCGFAKALEEEGLRPKLITGSSAGAIVGACMATELPAVEVEKVFLSLTKNDFFDPGWGWGYLKGELFEQSLLRFLPSHFDSASTPLHIATYDIFKRRTAVFHQGPDLAKAVRASCAVPFFFHPVRINKRYYWDGGIQDKMGISDVPEDHLILGHYLRSGKMADWFEARNVKNKVSQKLLICSYDKLPKSGPNRLDAGPAAIEMAYKETKRCLYQDISLDGSKIQFFE